MSQRIQKSTPPVKEGRPRTPILLELVDAADEELPFL